MNLALALVRQTTRLRKDLEAEQADHRRDVEALRDALHASVSALHDVTRERDRYRAAYHQQIDVNRELRDARATAPQRSAA